MTEQQIIPSIYLDNNIIVDIENGELNLGELMNQLGVENGNFRFSSAHLWEALEMSSDDPKKRRAWLVQRCKTIEDICGSSYIHGFLDGSTQVMVQTPFVMLDSIDSEPLSQTMAPLLKLFNKDVRRAFKEDCPFDIRNLANVHYKKVFAKLDDLLLNHFKQTLDQIIQTSQDYHDDFESHECHKYAQYFELLDLMGFQTDKHTPKSNYARYQDSQHCLSASLCDVFITSDERTAFKSLAVYNKEAVKTIVVTIKRQKK